MSKVLISTLVLTLRCDFFFLMALAERGVASNVPFASEFAKCVLPV